MVVGMAVNGMLTTVLGKIVGFPTGMMGMIEVGTSLVCTITTMVEVVVGDQTLVGTTLVGNTAITVLGMVDV
jgi:hypothetical protein